MAQDMTGTKQVQQDIVGDGMSPFVAFTAKENEPDSLSKGQGYMTIHNIVRDKTNKTIFYDVKDSSTKQMVCDLQQMLNYTYSNGMTGYVALQILSEAADLIRNGTFVKIVQ